MNAAAKPLAVWAALLGLSTGLQIALGGDLLPVALLGGAAVGTALLAAAAGLQRVRAGGRLTSPELSAAAAIIGISLCAVLAGVAAGGWLVIGGAIGLAGGVLLLAREWRQERRVRAGGGPAP